MFYSKSTGGFYDEGMHGARQVEQVTTDPATGVTLDRWTEANPDCKIPADAVEITAVEHTALLEAQSAGKCIQADASGKPVVVDPPPPTDAELAATARAKRDSMIAAVAWRYERHARELRLGLTPTDNLAALDIYVQALADVTKQSGFPSTINWPVAI